MKLVMLIPMVTFPAILALVALFQEQIQQSGWYRLGIMSAGIVAAICAIVCFHDTWRKGR